MVTIGGIVWAESELGAWRGLGAGLFLPALPRHPDLCSTERGDFLALDLGGTHFRVLLVRLAAGSVQITNEVYSIPECVAQGSGQQVPRGSWAWVGLREASP